MTVVVDASVIAAFLVDGGRGGRWAEKVVLAGDLVAPHHLPIEVASTLRRVAATGQLGPETASLAHHDLLQIPIALVPYGPLGERAWELRHSVTSYDAAYVALAERLEVPCATLDGRLARAPGPRCEFWMPELDD